MSRHRRSPISQLTQVSLFSQTSVDEGLLSVKSHRKGLTSAEAQRRLEEYGPNRLAQTTRKSVIQEILKQLTHFFALILWSAAILAFISDFFAPQQGMRTLGVAILLVIWINAFFAYWQEFQAEKTLEKLKQLLPQKATVYRDQRQTQIAIEELVPGDLILVQEGDRVSADARMIEAQALQVNSSALTGESFPEVKSVDRPKDQTNHPSSDLPLLQATNLLFAGSLIVSGTGKAVVYATGMQTEFGKIARLSVQTVKVEAPIEQEVRRLSQWIAGLSIALGIFFFWIGSHQLPFWENALFFIGIIVANVPEGLLPTVTLSLALAAQRMAKKKALVRHLPAVQALGSATVICTDKTGTLTQNKMQVHSVFTLNTQILFNDSSLPILNSDPAFHRVSDGIRYARDPGDFSQASLEGRGLPRFNDPMDIALSQMAHRAHRAFLDSRSPPRLESKPCLIAHMPFQAHRKRVTYLFQQKGHSLWIFTQGALETLLPLCQWVHEQTQKQRLTAEIHTKILSAETAFAEQGLRVLGFATRDLAESSLPPASTFPLDRFEKDLVFLGLIALRDPPRPEVTQAVHRCRQAGLKMIMLTGDHPLTAKALGQEIGLYQTPNPRVITGNQLQQLSPMELQLALDEDEILFARLASDQKLTLVQALQRKGERVAVTGDGVNDAPALKEAHVGIAMGASGTEVARESADLILLDDHFATLVDAIEEGRAVYVNIRKFLTYILSSNVPELIPYLAFMLLKMPLALTVIQILAIDLGTDLLPALALGAEKPETDLMNQRPEKFQGNLITPPLLIRAYLFLGLYEAFASLSLFWIFLKTSEGNSETGLHYRTATTVCLGSIILLQMLNVHLCRSESQSLFKIKFLSNSLLNLGLLFEGSSLLLLLYTPLGALFFGTAPPPLQMAGYAIPFLVGMLLLEEIRKKKRRG